MFCNLVIFIRNFDPINIRRPWASKIGHHAVRSSWPKFLTYQKQEAMATHFNFTSLSSRSLHYLQTVPLLHLSCCLDNICTTCVLLQTVFCNIPGCLVPVPVQNQLSLVQILQQWGCYVPTGLHDKSIAENTIWNCYIYTSKRLILSNSQDAVVRTLSGGQNWWDLDCTVYQESLRSPVMSNLDIPQCSKMYTHCPRSQEHKQCYPHTLNHWVHLVVKYLYPKCCNMNCKCYHCAVVYLCIPPDYGVPVHHQKRHSTWPVLLTSQENCHMSSSNPSVFQTCNTPI